jgi:hypothetical protein
MSGEANLMKLSIKATAITMAILWGGAVLLVGAVNRFVPNYGDMFLYTVASIYPGFVAEFGMKNLAIGVAFATLDGLIGGAILAWVYNKVLNCCCCKKEEASS